MFGRGFDLQQIILTIPAILIGFTFHEYAHAKMADKLGDKTPRFQGKLTLNPFVHVDPLGFLFILIAGIGWAKPVETNPSAFKRYYKDDLKVSLAGPIANFIVAVMAAVLYGIYLRFVFPIIGSGTLGIVLGQIISYTLSVNVMLFIFNLIPLPGFDGAHILRDLWPKTFYKYEGTMQKYRYIILLLILFVPIVSNIIFKPIQLLTNLLLGISKLIMFL